MLHALDAQNLTTRARTRAWREKPTHSRQHGRSLSSLHIGTRGSPAYARIYNKTLQATADAPIRELWKQRGYNPGEHGRKVWRVEFEIRPALLRQLRADGEQLPQEPDQIITTQLDTLWAYLTGSWLTLRDRLRK